VKKNYPVKDRAREAQTGNFTDPALGRPLPHSSFLFDRFCHLHYARWYGEPEAFCDRSQPNLVVLHTTYKTR
jgi:hypothetical protein